MAKQDKLTIEISPRSIFLSILIPLGLYSLWMIKDIIFSLLIGFILMSAMRPAVNLLNRKGLSRTVACFLVYAVFLVCFIFLISLIIPPIIIETTNLLRNFPMIIDRLNPSFEQYIDTSSIVSYIPNVTNNLLGLIGIIFSNTFFIISTLFFGLYFLLEENSIQRFIGQYMDEKNAQRVSSIFTKAEERMSSWFWGEITLMTVVGVLTYVGLNIIGMKYALPLAVLAGILEVVPNIGPTISAIPAVIIAMSSSYFAGFSTLALYIIVQQLENSIIVPMIMRRAVGINPIITLIALMVGGRIGGVLGVLLAIPLFLFVETIITEILHIRASSKLHAK
ncbi:MAG: AI-2E family transporter [Weeksellaceae bacterium]